jgi:hypothetical protein
MIMSASPGGDSRGSVVLVLNGQEFKLTNLDCRDLEALLRAIRKIAEHSVR